MSSDKSRGIYRKYNVTRTDGSSGPGGKHENCAYFVLDLEHDEFANVALKAYAKACRKTHPQLASDIDDIIAHEYRPCGCREAMCPHVSAFAPNTSSEMAHNLMDRSKDSVQASQIWCRKHGAKPGMTCHPDGTNCRTRVADAARTSRELKNPRSIR